MWSDESRRTVDVEQLIQEAFAFAALDVAAASAGVSVSVKRHDPESIDELLGDLVVDPRGASKDKAEERGKFGYHT